MAMLLTLFWLFVSFFFYVDAQQTLPLVPALYVFGDSTVDGGNRPIGAPYGIDLNATIPTRFTNGKTTADFLATFLGLPIVPPYANMLEAGISKTGVNYAYSGCGILPETCPWPNWSFDEQIDRFNSTMANNLSKTFSPQELVQHLSNSIFLLSFGINDYNRNYLPPSNATLSNLEPDVFAKFLLNELAARLKTLYGFGARKFLVNNIWPLGCIPDYAKKSDPLTNGCNETINEMVRPYSNGLPQMLKKLESKLSGVVFSHSNNFQFVEDLKDNPTIYGITNTTGECYSTNEFCPNRDKYLYFDFLHTTQAANHVFSLNCFNGTLCSPLNVIHLAGAN